MSNQDNEEYMLNHRAFVLLGLVAEIPSYAYNINQRIEERGMRDWTNIGKSSIYNIITKLEEDGLVESYIEEVDNRIRKIYTITDYGSEILRNKAYNVISEFIGKNDEDFYVAFSMLPILTKKQQIDAITKSLKKIKTHQRELERMLEEISHMPLNVRGLFVHPIKILGIDIEFLEWALKEIQKGGEKESWPKSI